MKAVAGDWFDLPMAARAPRPIWAVGDVHGCTDHLAVLHGVLRERASAGELLVYMGDYVDRGRDSPGALTMAARGPGVAGLERIALRGNHDAYLMNGAGLEPGGIDEALVDRWLHHGGESTVDDLGTDPAWPPDTRAERLRAALGPERIAFLRGTRFMHREGRIILVHAGLNPALTLDAQAPADLMWIRDPFLDCPPRDWPFDCLVVHGHTPCGFGAAHHRIGVDALCFSSGELAMLEMRETRGRFHRALL